MMPQTIGWSHWLNNNGMSMGCFIDPVTAVLDLSLA